jgi:RNA polymerase sigma-70 factor (ECF subfamily)
MTAIDDGELARALASWPGVHVSAFRAHLSSLPSWEPAALAELALAFAAASGVTSAITELTTRLESPLRAAVMRAGYTRALAEDATQEALILLLVEADASAPALLTYRGRAPLTAWAKTIALRLAGKQHAAIADAKVRDAHGGSAFDTVPDCVARALRAELRGAVERAFTASAATLSLFDRELLRATIIEGQTIDRLAAHHDVHRATAARWIGRARGALDDALRTALAKELALSDAEVSSVLRAVQTSLVLPVEALAR